MKSEQPKIDKDVALTVARSYLETFFLSENERAESLLHQFDEREKKTGQTLDVLAFMAGQEEYGLPIDVIQEILKVSKITELPRTKLPIMGITSIRGTIVPVWDFRHILGVEQANSERANRLLVLKGNRQSLAVLVDSVSHVMRFDKNQIETPPENTVSRHNHFIDGIGRQEARMIILLNASMVLKHLEEV